MTKYNGLKEARLPPIFGSLSYVIFSTFFFNFWIFYFFLSLRRWFSWSFEKSAYGYGSGKKKKLWLFYSHLENPFFLKKEDVLGWRGRLVVWMEPDNMRRGGIELSSCEQLQKKYLKQTFLNSSKIGYTFLFTIHNF